MILFENVTKVYEPDVIALDSVSCAIDKGEFVFVVGASGSGKTTLVRLLLKELEPSDGRIIVGGRDIGRLKSSQVPLLRRNIGCVFQDFKLLPSRTAAENVAYALKVQGESRSAIRRKVPEVMTLVGLARKMNSLPDELSGGEQQRTAVAMAMVGAPPVILADEPTAELDIATAIALVDQLHELADGGTTVVVNTHDPTVIERADRVLTIHHGTMHSERRSDRTTALIDEVGRIQIPPALLDDFPDRRALIVPTEDGLLLSPPEPDDD